MRERERERENEQTCKTKRWIVGRAELAKLIAVWNWINLLPSQCGLRQKPLSLSLTEWHKHVKLRRMEFIKVMSVENRVSHKWLDVVQTVCKIVIGSWVHSYVYWIGHSRSLFHSFKTVDRKQMLNIKFANDCIRITDSLVSEATTPPTEPQPATARCAVMMFRMVLTFVKSNNYVGLCQICPSYSWLGQFANQLS